MIFTMACGRRSMSFLIIMALQLVAYGDTVTQEGAALHSLTTQWGNPPQNWDGLDPCGGNWIGINCTNSHIVTIMLSNFQLNGSLSGDLGFFRELLMLDLSYNPGLGGPIPSSIGNLVKLKTLILDGCSFSGLIPPEIGNLARLTFLGLNSNSFRGSLPSTIGNLSSLYWLDITDNMISGQLPVSDGNNLGLDLLTKARHFHFGKNSLSGQIPAKLFHSEMILLHLLLDNNNFSGSIPPSIGQVKSLEAIRLDWNHFTGPVPSSISNLTAMTELLLSNNKFTGPMPNLNGMNNLAYVDLSNNSFDETDIPKWFTTLPSMTTLLLEYLSVSGELPSELFTFPPLQTLRLRNNAINGTLSISRGYSIQLQTIDLQNNKIQGFDNEGGYSHDLLLVGNPVCNQGLSNELYCKAQQSAPPYSTPLANCVALVCPSDQDLSPICDCGYPFSGTIYYRLMTISNLHNASYFRSLEASLMTSFQQNQIPVGSAALHNPFMDSENYLQVTMQFFPSGKARFSQEELSRIGHLFSNHDFRSLSVLGPYYFIGTPYLVLPEGSKSTNKGAIIGASVGGAVLVCILLGVILLVMHQKRKLEKVVELSKGFGSWDPSSGSIPQLTGPRLFTFEELQKCTGKFSESNSIGSGGYGKVYRGTLPGGQLVAVKRAEQGSMQGGVEFKTEIELLSRVHHRNLVSLVGFCSDHGEQLLVYDYVPNGNLKESLSGKSGVFLDWKRRLHVALDAAKGLAYLHELCSPPIAHRDVKSNNILLDDHLNAKVSDFGLSKPLGDNRRGHVTTQVKGTMGYLDPEYYMTQQLTEKSDVYSFGVVLLEIITAKKPIENGKYIVRQVRISMDRGKDLYGLDQLLDPRIIQSTKLVGFQRFVDLAIRCVAESGMDRPTMSDAVKEIEGIMLMAGLNPNSETTSASYDETSGSNTHPYNNDKLFGQLFADVSSR